MKLACACDQNYIYDHNKAGAQFECKWCKQLITMPHFNSLSTKDQTFYRNELQNRDDKDKRVAAKNQLDLKKTKQRTAEKERRVLEKADVNRLPQPVELRKEIATDDHKWDNPQKIGAWIAGGGLLILALSPFFKWVNFGAGGVTGLAGDGKIVLVATVIGSTAYLAAIVRRKWLTPVFLGVQAGGTLAVFWMGALLWKIGSITNLSNMEDNPFAAMFAAMLISPGAGLYLGLIGGIAVAGALGFVIIHRLLLVANLKLFYASQGLSCFVGILMIALISQNLPTSNDTASGSLFSSQTKEENVIDAQLGETFALGNLEITPKSIDLVTLGERTTFRGDFQPRDSKSYVLTFVVQNTSEGQVFSAFSTTSVVDEFDNVCPDPIDGSSYLSSTRIVGNDRLKDIRPGESATIKVAFDPVLESAKEYTLTISTQVSNQDDYRQWRIRFSPN